MPLALSARMSHIWYHTDSYQQWKGVIWPRFVFRTEDTGAEDLPTIDHSSFSKISIMTRRFCREIVLFLFFSCTGVRYPKAQLPRITRKVSKIWLRRANFECFVSPKDDLTRTLRNEKATTKNYHMFSVQKSKCDPIFERRTLTFCTHVRYVHPKT